MVKAVAPYGDLATVDREHDDAAPALAAVLRTRTADEWERDLSAADVACVVVAKGPSEAALMGADGLCKELGMTVDADHPIIGAYPRLKPMVTFSRSGTSGPSCRCGGEHTNAVLHASATPHAIDELRDAPASSADERRDVDLRPRRDRRRGSDSLLPTRSVAAADFPSGS